MRFEDYIFDFQNQLEKLNQMDGESWAEEAHVFSNIIQEYQIDTYMNAIIEDFINE